MFSAMRIFGDMNDLQRRFSPLGHTGLPPLTCLSACLACQVQILRELDHPNIVQIYQFYPKDPAYYYVVLEYMVGGELFDRIVKKVWSPPPHRPAPRLNQRNRSLDSQT